MLSPLFKRTLSPKAVPMLCRATTTTTTTRTTRTTRAAMTAKTADAVAAARLDIGARHLSLSRTSRPATSHVFSTIAHPAREYDQSRFLDINASMPSPVATFKRAVQQEPMQTELDEASAPIWDNPIPHAVYSLDAIAHIEATHHKPTKMHERAALFAVKAMRASFDIVSGYRGPGGAMTERDWLNRCLFLETVAGVPGMVAGMARHLRSLRSMRRDYGWIHTLLEEAENERMHLLIFMKMKQPGWMFRAMVFGAQGVFVNAFFLAYLAAPRTCHRFVGYLEEEAVKTYTALLQDIEDGHLREWECAQAPLIARNYYKLPDSAQFVDVIKCIRADEANHRDVNHTFAGLDQHKDVNPFIHGH